jgi:hypothetical protein
VKRLVPLVVAAALLTVAAGCNKSEKTSARTTGASVTAPESLFAGTRQPATFTKTRAAIRRLYADHPEIRNFVYRDVFYTPQTRDKVLAVCRVGGPTVNARERETSRVFGCAPLIFFFYSFGKRKRVAESVDVARTLYRYAAGIQGPYDPRPPLTDLLRSWGVA